jgi:hypothetical protein
MYICNMLGTVVGEHLQDLKVVTDVQLQGVVSSSSCKMLGAVPGVQ